MLFFIYMISLKKGSKNGSRDDFRGIGYVA